MKQITCPHCGKKIDSLSRVCPYCHYDLKAPKNVKQKDVKDDTSKQAPKKHSKWKYAVGSVAILLLCVGGGSVYYHMNNTPQHESAGYNHTANKVHHHKEATTKPTEKTTVKPAKPTISKSSINDSLTSVCTDLDNITNHADANTSLSDYYVGGSSNKYYKQVKSWAESQHQSDALLKMTTSTKVITADPLSRNQADVMYHMKYKFKHSGKVHVQVFKWYAKMEKVNGTWKITKNVANNSPLVNRTVTV